MAPLGNANREAARPVILGAPTRCRAVTSFGPTVESANRSLPLPAPTNRGAAHLEPPGDFVGADSLIKELTDARRIDRRFPPPVDIVPALAGNLLLADHLATGVL